MAAHQIQRFSPVDRSAVVAAGLVEIKIMVVEVVVV